MSDYAGVVKSYNAERGYGFVTVCGKDPIDLFFHVSNLVPRRQSVPLGAQVVFDVVTGRKGPQCANIRVRLLKLNEAAPIAAPQPYCDPRQRAFQAGL